MLTLRTILSKRNNIFAIIFYLPALLLAVHVNAQQAIENVEILTQPVKIKTGDEHDLLLAGDYYLGKKRSGGVIVLHDCHNDRRSYKKIASSLAEQGLHALLLDFRGYGESIAEGFSRKQIKKKSVNIVEYQSEMALLTTYWQDDLLAAYQFLRSKLEGNQGISIVASGCGSIHAVALAEKILLNSMVIITPKMSYNDKERYKNLIDIPSYFVTSYHHQESYQIAQELFAWNGDKRSKIQTFKGDSYAYRLIARKKDLIKDIAHWIKSTVDK
ncbi:MAG: hypothetical protein QF552_05300 [Litorilituus sp.]|jgi:dienelactone hydrolase|nr:hypothetical protein [Litorilituus sp.]